MFDLDTDPDEMNNLAAGERDQERNELIASLNGKLNEVMDREFGPDDGRELPRTLDRAGWLLKTVDL